MPEDIHIKPDHITASKYDTTCDWCGGPIYREERLWVSTTGRVYCCGHCTNQGEAPKNNTLQNKS